MENESIYKTKGVFFSQGTTLKKNKHVHFTRRERGTKSHFSMQNENIVICGLLTVLGLVRFLASVSQLLRWLYVLLLHDINRKESALL